MKRRGSVYLLGAPGVGKGTQADLLAKQYGMSPFSTGDMLRQARKENTDLGKKAAVYMEKGQLVPDELIIGLVEQKLSKTENQGGFIFDGFPRTLLQAQALDDLLLKKKEPKLKVAFIELSIETLRERLLGRLFCPNCQKTYHVKNYPPRREGFCDSCNKPLIVREDDRPETVERRLVAYFDQTAPLIDYYKKTGNLKVVNGLGTVEQVLNALIIALELEG